MPCVLPAYMVDILYRMHVLFKQLHTLYYFNIVTQLQFKHHILLCLGSPIHSPSLSSSNLDNAGRSLSFKTLMNFTKFSVFEFTFPVTLLTTSLAFCVFVLVGRNNPWQTSLEMRLFISSHQPCSQCFSLLGHLQEAWYWFSWLSSLEQP